MLKKVFFALCVSCLLAGCVAYPYSRPYVNQDSTYYEESQPVYSQPRPVYVAPPSIYFRFWRGDNDDRGRHHNDDEQRHHYRH
jgi:hypothetical protein